MANGGSDRSAGLDAVRVLACLLVLAYHLRGIVHADLGPLNAFADHGDSGVFVFFTLSGYLLYRPFLRGPVDLRAYAIRRAARILPGYWLAVVALAVFTGSSLPATHALAYATVTSSYDLSLWSFLRVSWTLSAEVAFYVALPVIAALARGRELAGLLASAAASIAYGVFVLLSLGPDNQWLVWTLPVVFYQFVPGMVLAVVEARHPRAFASLRSPVAALAGAAILAWSLTPSPTGLELRTGVGAALLMGWLVQRRVPFARGFAFLGGASYAVYLWHVDVLQAYGAIGLVLVAVAAVGSWVLLERPVLGWAQRLAPRRGVRAAQPVPAAPGANAPATAGARPIAG